MPTPWIKKYTPKTSSELIGHKTEFANIKRFIQNFKRQKKKALLLYGPSGVGKTCSVYAIAHDLHLEIIEVNASDFRNKDMINSTIGQASKQLSLFRKGKIILVDEIDGLSGKRDRGGIGALASLLTTTSFPLILTATNPYTNKLSSIRTKSELIHLKELSYLEIFEFLKKIAKKEHIKYEEKDLKTLARLVGGDLRAAINDLQSLTQNTKELEKSDLDDLAQRAKRESMLEALVKIFKIKDPKIALSALNNVDEDLDQSLLWIDANLPKEYTNPNDLARAYENLSKADVFKGRIRRWQHWRFLIYINALITAGIATAKTEKNKEFIQYKPTGRILKLWHAKMKYLKRKAIAEKIAQRTHTSTKYAIKHTLPYLQPIFKKNKEEAKKLTHYLDLNKEEVAWLKK